MSKTFLQENNIKPKYVSYIIHFLDLNSLFIKAIEEDTSIKLETKDISVFCDHISGSLAVCIEDDISEKDYNAIYDYYKVNSAEEYLFAEVLTHRITGTQEAFICSLPDIEDETGEDDKVVYVGSVYELLVPYDYYISII